MNEVVQHVVQEDFADISGEQSVKYLKSSSSSTREYRVPCIGSVTGTNTPNKLSFSVKLNPNEALDRCVMVEYTVAVTVESAANNTDVFKTNGLALGCYPLNRICTDLNLKINNNGKSCNPSEYIAAFSQTHDSSEYRRMQTFPSQPDNFNTITGMSRTSGIRLDTATGLESLAALSATVVETPQTNSESPFSQSGASYGGTRVSFPPENISFVAKGAGNKASVTKTFRVTEPLVHPILRTSDFRSVMARISNLDVDLTLSNLNAMFTVSNSLLKSVDAAGALTQAAFGSITFTEQPCLIYRTFTPTVSIPQVLSFGFYDNVVLRENLPQLAAGDAGYNQFGYNTRTYTLGQVPNRIMIFAKPTGVATDASRADAFLAIRKLTIRTNADSGGLSGASLGQLYQMSARNGLNMPYSKFSRDVGSVVIIDLEKGDLAGYLPGVRQDFNFDVSVTLQNTQFKSPAGIAGNFFQPGGLDADNRNYDLFIIAYQDSKIILDGTMASIINGENPELVRQILNERPLTLVPDSMVGGKSGWHKFTNFLGSVVRSIPTVVNTVSQVRSLLGRGEHDYGMGAHTGGTVYTGGGIKTLG